MNPEVQKQVAELWKGATTENLTAIGDLAGYKSDFLNLYSFGTAALMLGGAPFADVPFSGYSGGKQIVSPVWTDVNDQQTSAWNPINTDISTTTSSKLMLGGAPFGDVPFSGFTGGTTVVTPGWKDIINN